MEGRNERQAGLLFINEAGAQRQRWNFCSQPPEGSAGQAELWLAQSSIGVPSRWRQLSVSPFFPPRGHDLMLTGSKYSIQGHLC